MRCVTWRGYPSVSPYTKALGLKGFITGKAAVGGHKPGVGGASLGADMTFMFDSIAGTVTLAATITFESDYFSAVIKGAYSNDCTNITQFDFVTGNATLDVDSMVVGKAGRLLRTSSQALDRR
jgi:hypothetical protein